MRCPKSAKLAVGPCHHYHQYSWFLLPQLQMFWGIASASSFQILGRNFVLIWKFTK